MELLSSIVPFIPVLIAAIIRYIQKIVLVVYIQKKLNIGEIKIIYLHMKLVLKVAKSVGLNVKSVILNLKEV